MDKFNPFPLDEVARILPVLTLFATAVVVLVLDLFLRSWNAEPAPDDRPAPRSKWLLPGVSLLGTALATALAVRELSVAETTTIFNGALQIDLFSSWVTCLVLVGTLLTVGAAIGYARRLDVEHGELYALFLFAAGSMALLAQSNNLIMVFVSLETFSMAVYVLTSYTRDSQRSVEGALKYFVLGGVSSAFLLLGLTFIFGATGEIRIDTMAAIIADPAAAAVGVDTHLLIAGLGLSVVALGFKVGAFPFHAWIPDAYEGAPVLVTGFMSVTVKSAAFAVLVRFALMLTGDQIPEAAEYLTEAVWWLAAGTMVFGNLVALVQSSVKRMLAYSAISHTGYLLIGVVAALRSTGEATGAPILFYLLPYTLMTFGAFAILAGLGRESREGETFESLRGLSRRRPFLAFAMMLFMVSLAGIPPTAGFWGKFYLFREAVAAGDWPLALVGIATTVMSVYYYLRVVIAMYMEPADEARQPASAFDCTLGPAIVVAIAAAAIVAIGIFPDELLELSEKSIESVARP